MNSRPKTGTVLSDHGLAAGRKKKLIHNLIILGVKTYKWAGCFYTKNSSTTARHDHTYAGEFGSSLSLGRACLAQERTWIEPRLRDCLLYTSPSPRD